MAELKKKRKIKQSKAFVEGELIEVSECRGKIKISSLKKKGVKSSRGFPSFISFHPFLFWFQILCLRDGHNVKKSFSTLSEHP